MHCHAQILWKRFHWRIPNILCCLRISDSDCMLEMLEMIKSVVYIFILKKEIEGTDNI